MKVSCTESSLNGRHRVMNVLIRSLLWSGLVFSKLVTKNCEKIVKIIKIISKMKDWSFRKISPAQK